MNIDGIRGKPNTAQKQKVTLSSNRGPVLTKVTAPKASTSSFKIFKLIDHKQVATIITTFVITFALSIATSQGLASMVAKEETISSSKAAIANQDLLVTNQPDFLPFYDTVQSTPGEVYLPKEDITLPDPLKKRKEFLEKYLRAKKSPLADHVDAISEQSQWKLIIGISRAESSFCKRQVANNCWGIGGAWNMKNYENFDVAVSDVNRILERYYIQAGLNTPKKIVRKYVGHHSDNWQAAVEQELENLKDVE